jgi:Rrf2 family protein
MKISTKGRYALRMMLDIAKHNTGEAISIKDISARQDISIKYLEQIVSMLVKAGFLKSIRGPQGGYLLAKKPSEYTCGSILRVTEGALEPVDGLSGEDVGENADAWALLRLWRELDEAIQGVVDHYTLEDLLTWSEMASNNFVI